MPLTPHPTEKDFVNHQTVLPIGPNNCVLTRLLSVGSPEGMTSRAAVRQTKHPLAGLVDPGTVQDP